MFALRSPPAAPYCVRGCSHAAAAGRALPAAQRSSHSALAAAQCGSCCPRRAGLPTRNPSLKGQGQTRIPAKGGLSQGWRKPLWELAGGVPESCVCGRTEDTGGQDGFVLVQGRPKGETDGARGGVGGFIMGWELWIQTWGPTRCRYTWESPWRDTGGSLGWRNDHLDWCLEKSRDFLTNPCLGGLSKTIKSKLCPSPTLSPAQSTKYHIQVFLGHL